jgi:hypothetical protein
MIGCLRFIVVGLLTAACGRGAPTPAADQEQSPGASAQKIIHEGRELRGFLVKVGSRYRYDYYDVYEPDSSLAALNAAGYQGGGPTWLGIVQGLIQLRQPTLLRELDFDEEGEGLAIWSKNRAALVSVATLITDAKEDPKVLSAAIAEAVKAGHME